jgi:hypothetical protein
MLNDLNNCVCTGNVICARCYRAQLGTRRSRALDIGNQLFRRPTISGLRRFQTEPRRLSYLKDMLADGDPEAAVVLFRQGRALAANRALEGMLEFKLDRIVGSRPQDIPMHLTPATARLIGPILMNPGIKPRTVESQAYNAKGNLQSFSSLVVALNIDTGPITVVRHSLLPFDLGTQGLRSL